MGRVAVEDIAVRYGAATAVAGVSMQFESGQISAVVGPNGAGKSSLLLAMYGAVKSTGRVWLDETDISPLRPAARARLGIAIVPQGRQIFPQLTVLDNLRVMAEVLRVGGDAIDEAMQRFPVLEDRSRQLAGVLSGGEQQMLAVTRALMGDARVVLLDEMTTGLAPKIVSELMVTARELADRNKIVILADPSIGAIKDEIDAGYVLLRGQVAGETDGGGALEALYRDAIGVAQ